MAWQLSYGWLTLPLIALAAWYGFLRYRDVAVGSTDDALLVRKRGLTRITGIVRRRRIQSSETVSSFWQRRRGLADFGVFAASTTGGRRFCAPELDAVEAERLASWCVGSPLTERRPSMPASSGSPNRS